MASCFTHAAGRPDRTIGRRCTLPRGEAHVWFASLRVPDGALGELDLTLSAGERMRADRLRRSNDRARFIAAHGIARTILSRYEGVEPRAVPLEPDRGGRPILVRPAGETPLRFSMSHAGNAALFGVAGDREIGVDIELIDPRGLDERASRRILSAGERAALDAMPPAARTDALFRWWTLKEALLKARGTGLATPPSTIDLSTVSLDARKTLTLRTGDGGTWTLAAIPAPPGCAAAAACRGSGCRFTCRLFEDLSAESAAAEISL